jgi:hypothetical protein
MPKGATSGASDSIQPSMRTEQVRFDLSPEVVGADLFEESGDEVARVVDEDVNPAELVDRSLSGSLGIVGIGDVELDGEQVVVGSDGGGDPLRVAARGHYRGAGSQCGLGDVCSHAASSTCDQPNFFVHRIFSRFGLDVFPGR